MTLWADMDHRERQAFISAEERNREFSRFKRRLRHYPKYFDRDGKRMQMLDWARLLEDPSYKRVAEDTLPDGTWISTVWLGLDHAYGIDARPQIYETMVFRGKAKTLHDDAWRELDVNRYSTEREAVEGHKAMVQKWLKKQLLTR